MHRPARAVGVLTLLHQPQPVTGEMEEELLHARKEAWQRADVLQLLGAHLRLHLLIGILLFWWRIEPKALGAFPFELELQPPHILLWIECLATASGEEFGIGLVALLLGLQRLVVEPRHHLAAAKLDAGRSAALEVERALDPSWTDEAAQLLREIAQRWRIATLPVDVDVRARDLGGAEGDGILRGDDLVSVEMRTAPRPALPHRRLPRLRDGYAAHGSASR